MVKGISCKVDLFILEDKVYACFDNGRKEFELTFKNFEEGMKFIDHFKSALTQVQTNGYYDCDDTIVISINENGSDNCAIEFGGKVDKENCKVEMKLENSDTAKKFVNELSFELFGIRWENYEMAI